MLEELLKKLKEANIDSNELNGFISNYKKMETEISTLETKATSSVNDLEKYKNQNTLLMSKIGLEDIENLDETIENLKKNSKASTDNSKEIKELEDLIRSKDLAISDMETDFKNKLFEKDMSIELNKKASDIGAVNSEAQKIIVAKLKDNAQIEDGKIVYKNADGSYERSNGLPISLEDKLNSLRSSENFSFLFKNDAKSGTDVNIESSNSSSVTVDQKGDGLDDLRLKAKKLGIDYNNLT